MLTFITFAVLALAVTALPSPGPSVSFACPPISFDSVKEFDLLAYLGQWYTQAQKPTSYSPVSQNYCVAARYSLNADGSSFDVFNQARKSSVTGPLNSIHLRGTIPRKNDPSKIKISFTFIPFPNAVGGNYWVVATSPIINGMYDWAIITGGAPTLENASGCSVPGDHGMWLFTRDATPPKEKLLMIKDTARKLGLDVSVLNDVEHNGCTYAHQ
jgi:lipocalin